MPKFSVDIQETHEYTYQVDAVDAADAIIKAKEMHQEGELQVHDEVFDSDVTNVEEM